MSRNRNEISSLTEFISRVQVITAEGEKKASRCIKEAADVLAESPLSIQLRYLQTLQSISEEQNHTVVLPIPKNMLLNMGLGGGNGQVSGGDSEIKPPATGLPIQTTASNQSTPTETNVTLEKDLLIQLNGGNTQF